MTFLGLICKKYFCGQAYIFLIELNGDILGSFVVKQFLIEKVFDTLVLMPV